jgi:hypothetical protein
MPSAISVPSGNTFLKRRKMDAGEKDELVRYLNTETCDPEVNPLTWWMSQKGYPNLSQMAKDVLAIPATSAAGERVFSKGRLMMPFNR